MTTRTVRLNDSSSEPVAYRVHRRNKGETWVEIGTVKTMAEAIDMTCGNGKWWIESVYAEPTEPTLLDATG